MIPDAKFNLIDDTFVVRDDLIAGGTKRSFADGVISGHEEVVYASPVYGGAQIAIAHAARELGIRSTIICAKRNKPHARTLEAHKAGAKIIQVPHGYLSNIKAKAKKYCSLSGAFLLPFGLESELAFDAIAARAAKVQEQIGDLDEVWCVAGSGVLVRGLQRGLNAKRFRVVQIGRALSKKDIGAAELFIHKLDFSQDARVKPPFPSCSNYDAKAWEYVMKYGKGRKLFWNVMA